MSPLASEDCRLALAALMVRVARSDDSYASVEIALIDRVLVARYGLDAAAAASLRDKAEKLEAQAPDTVRFTRLIKDAVPHEDREAVAEALWRVVMADDHRDDHENAFLRMVVNLIGVSDKDSALARQRAVAKPL
jgi:uncharacterized tellurite resistance protein B-like protein